MTDDPFFYLVKKPILSFKIDVCECTWLCAKTTQKIILHNIKNPVI